MDSINFILMLLFETCVSSAQNSYMINIVGKRVGGSQTTINFYV